MRLAHALSGILFAAALLLNAAALAQTAARVTFVTGAIYAQTPKGEVKRLVLGSEVAVGDQVSTEPGSSTRLTFSDGAEFLLRENSRVMIEAYSFVEQKPEADNLLMRLLKGGLRAVSGLIGKRGNPRVYRLDTIVSTIGIRGTVFDALLCQQDCLGGGDGLYTRAIQEPHTLTNDTGETEVPEGASFYVQDRASRPVDISDLGETGLSFPSVTPPGDAPDRRPVRPECF